MKALSRILVLALLVVVLMSSTAVNAQSDEVPREDTLVLGWWGGTTFDEHDIWSPFVLGASYQKGMNLAYEGLAYWNPFRDEIIMWQAESFVYNDDFTELTINLRPEVRWSDGEPFTADDVVYTINTLRDLGSEVRHGGEVAALTVEAVAADDHTVVISLTQPAPRYHDRFFIWKWDSGAFPIMPQHIFEGQDWSTFTHFDLEQGWPVSTGALEVVAASPEQKILDRRADWWAVEAGIADELEMARVVNLAAGSDETVLVELMVGGDLDITAVTPDTAKTAIDRNPAITTHSGQNPPYGYTDWYAQALFLNNRVAPFDNPDVRWGVSYFIDRDQIVDFAWNGNSAPSEMPFPPYAGLLDYTESISDLLAEYDTNEFNPEKGAARLEAAGYTMNDEGMWVDADGNTLRIEIESGHPQWNASGQVIEQQLRNAGIDATYAQNPDSRDRWVSRTYTAYISGHPASLREPYDALNLYTCDLEIAEGEAQIYEGNPSQWCTPEFNEIVDRMSRVHPDDRDQMFALFREAMETWLPVLPSVQLFDWMHNFIMLETYWTNWPTVDNEQDGEYMNEAPQLLGFYLVVINLEKAQ